MAGSHVIARRFRPRGVVHEANDGDRRRPRRNVEFRGGRKCSGGDRHLARQNSLGFQGPLRRWPPAPCPPGLLVREDCSGAASSIIPVRTMRRDKGNRFRRLETIGTRPVKDWGPALTRRLALSSPEPSQEAVPTIEQQATSIQR